MDEILFNKLFDRKTNNNDYLRARVSNCIKPILSAMLKNSKGGYVKSFYTATTNFNDDIIKKYGISFLLDTYNEILAFKDFLYSVFNSKNVKKTLKDIDYANFFIKYTALSKDVGFYAKSRILRRYNNFIEISTNFLNNKLPYQAYKNEILSDILFFDDNIIKKISPEDPEDILIYYFVYDIRAHINN